MAPLLRLAFAARHIMGGTAATLRYLDATAVLSPAGELRDFQVSDTGGFSLGTLRGFIVDPAARQLRYFVVEVARWLSTRRYLIPLCPATLEPQHRTVRLECDAPSKTQWREFDDRQFSRFSDDDLLEALFGGDARRSGRPAVR
jgi:PRC-barrel domain